MDKRAIYREFDLAGRHWRVGKWDARTGSYWAHKFISETPPKSVTEKLGSVGPFGPKPMSRADFFELQDDCLKLIEEELAGGWTGIVNEDGNFAVAGLEHEGGILLLFTIQAIDWNMTDFFPEDALASGARAGATS